MLKGIVKRTKDIILELCVITLVYTLVIYIKQN